MQAVIGLAERANDLNKVARRQKDIPKAACIGAGSAGTFYAFLGISAARCAQMGGATALWNMGTFLLFLLVGLGLGAVAGAFLARVETDEEGRLPGPIRQHTHSR